LVSSIRRVVSRANRGNDNDIPAESIEGTIEMDSHADTCVLGRNFVVLSYTGRVCDVYPYSETYEAIKDVPIVTAATAVQDESTGEVFILVIN
jgi:hypothetical protein